MRLLELVKLEDEGFKVAGTEIEVSPELMETPNLFLMSKGYIRREMENGKNSFDEGVNSYALDGWSANSDKGTMIALTKIPQDKYDEALAQLGNE